MEAMGDLPLFNYKLTSEWEYNFKALQRGEPGIPEEQYLSQLHDWINKIKSDTRGKSEIRANSSASSGLICPKCGGAMVSKVVNTAKGKKNVFSHAVYPNDCSFTVWRDILGATITETEGKTLLAGGTISKKLTSTKGTKWTQKLKLSDTGSLEFVQ